MPTYDHDHWHEQILDICHQLRDQYLRYPDISRAVLETAPHNPSTLLISEGLAILVQAGMDAQRSSWLVDAVLLYASAFCYEVALRTPNEGVHDAP